MDTKPAEWIEANKLRIKEAFELFDKDKADAIIKVATGTVQRAACRGHSPSDVSVAFFVD